MPYFYQCRFAVRVLEFLCSKWWQTIKFGPIMTPLTATFMHHRTSINHRQFSIAIEDWILLPLCQANLTQRNHDSRWSSTLIRLFYAFDIWVGNVISINQNWFGTDWDRLKQNHPACVVQIDFCNMRMSCSHVTNCVLWNVSLKTIQSSFVPKYRWFNAKEK